MKDGMIDSWLRLKVEKSGPEVIIKKSCSAQLSMKFQLLIKASMLKKETLSDGVFIMFEKTRSLV